MKTWMLSTLALAAALAGCGGGDEPVAALAHERRIAAAPLLDDAGEPQPSDPAAVPAEAAARTQAGRYASTLQADALETALRGGVIRVELDGDGEAAADLALTTAYGLQAAQDLPDSAPVLVRGGDLAQAARVADRLTARGYPNVWLVTL